MYRIKMSSIWSKWGQITVQNRILRKKFINTKKKINNTKLKQLFTKFKSQLN